jgi:hypothetical protein
VREEEDGMDIRYRLEDPFLAAWLHWTQKAGLCRIHADAMPPALSQK